MLIQFLKTGRGIPFSAMFAMKEYPADVLPLYAQGHSLPGFFIGQGGKAKFLEFIAFGLEDENWTGAVEEVLRLLRFGPVTKRVARLGPQTAAARSTRRRPPANNRFNSSQASRLYLTPELPQWV